MSENIFKILKEHLCRYPESEPQDIVKLIYQGCFGCGHMINDNALAFKRIEEEYTEALACDNADDNDNADAGDNDNGACHMNVLADKPSFRASCSIGERAIDIGGGYVRVDLTALRRDELPALSYIFIASAGEGYAFEQNEHFRENIHLLRKYIAEGALTAGFDISELDKYLDGYYDLCRSDEGDAGSNVGSDLPCYPAVSHSEAYRRAYSPHYRVVKREYFYYFDIVKAVFCCTCKHGINEYGVNKYDIRDGINQYGISQHGISQYGINQYGINQCGINQCCTRKYDIHKYCAPIISIDGRCGSGKSTLAKALSEIFGIKIVPADDFFLTTDQRTEKRLLEPGGNLDRERLKKEVLVPLSENKCGEITYRPYLCKEGRFGDEKLIATGVPVLVEGSYSQHPELAPYYKLKIFVSCSKALQFERLEKREGRARIESFRNKWIPLEEKYFSYFNIPENADIIFETEEFLDDLS